MKAQTPRLGGKKRIRPRSIGTAAPLSRARRVLESLGSGDRREHPGAAAACAQLIGGKGRRGGAGGRARSVGGGCREGRAAPSARGRCARGGAVQSAGTL